LPLRTTPYKFEAQAVDFCDETYRLGFYPSGVVLKKAPVPLGPAAASGGAEP